METSGEVPYFCRFFRSIPTFADRTPLSPYFCRFLGLPSLLGWLLALNLLLVPDFRRTVSGVHLIVIMRTMLCSAILGWLVFALLFAVTDCIDCTLDAVILTTGKDALAFERSINSSLKHFLDVRNYYIITPHVVELSKRYGNKLGPRVIFAGETGFPFNTTMVADVMYQSVKDAGKYELTGKSPFEGTMYGKLGWFLQQLLKFYAGKVLGLGDFILLDSDCVWFKDIRFISACNSTHKSFYYASSCQYHPSYMNTIGPISGVGPMDSKVHRSGIVHHMVLAKHVLDALINDTERRHSMPFWQAMLNVSAREMTCRAPRSSICGAGTNYTISEYENITFSYIV